MLAGQGQLSVSVRVARAGDSAVTTTSKLCDAVKAGFGIVNNRNGLRLGFRLILFACVAMMRSLDPCKKAFHPSAQKHRQPPSFNMHFLALGSSQNAIGVFPTKLFNGSPLATDSAQDALRARNGKFSEARVAEPQSSSSPLGRWRNTKCCLAGSNSNPVPLVVIYRAAHLPCAAHLNLIGQQVATRTARMSQC